MLTEVLHDSTNDAECTPLGSTIIFVYRELHYYSNRNICRFFVSIGILYISLSPPF